ncbi:beta-1,4-galactosyltransferase 4-like [Ostrinia furnacalis]|uniref:beta-1,4-galactosyltransferase 4-like n=1 Tax=Ostrinia furnacalis TaxID=93504 RepID=UPI00103C992C|nr:beta-1,4-galactosyltransferase 4-like [Ostrinia furnacalis]
MKNVASNIKGCKHWIFVIGIIVICLQHHYVNIDHKSQRATHATKTPKKRREVILKLGHHRLMSYQRFKSMNLSLKNVGKNEVMPPYPENTPICFFNKTNLGRIRVDRSYITPRKVERLRLGVRPGGFYAPPHCRSRHKVAILVPFRNRTTNLSKFLRHIHPFLQKQLLQYRIFVIEQYDKHKFNKGALYNIGYLETQRFGNWDCLVFHDVDLLPMDLRILYSCPRRPTHMCPALECWGYQKPYYKLFGGVTSMPTEMYLKVNGYSNEYWNWGAEDDDMFIRIHASRLAIWRYNMSIARFTCLPHPRGILNDDRRIKLATAKKRFKHEGLNSLEYRLIAIIQRKLFTHILADVNPFNYTV